MTLIEAPGPRPLLPEERIALAELSPEEIQFRADFFTSAIVESADNVRNINGVEYFGFSRTSLHQHIESIIQDMIPPKEG